MKIINNLEELISHFGLKKGANVNICIPQFNRKYDIEINYIPSTKEEFDTIISTTPKEILLKMGVGIWEEKEGSIHYLFPGEWFEYIPKGYEVVDIFGVKTFFDSKTHDDDIRYGCLAYGFIRKF